MEDEGIADHYAARIDELERELAAARAEAGELKTVLREMSTVLHSVVTTEAFAPPRDVPANTHWQAAGFWLGKAKALLTPRP